jgi:peptidoglycan-associated lipoprotein
MVTRSRVLTLATCVLAFGLAACNQSPASKPEVSSTSESAPTAMMDTPAAMPRATDFAPASEMKPIHFALDQHRIRSADSKTLDDNARWLKSRPEVLVQIGGHADERGSEVYNVDLGERRAQATMNALVARGVDSRRLSITSYGKQRPVCTESGEGCWAKNRRAELLLKTQ